MTLGDAPHVTLDVADCGNRVRTEPWPFLYSVVPGIGLVVNVAPGSPKKVVTTASRATNKAPTPFENTVVKRRPPMNNKGAQPRPFANPADVDTVLKEFDEVWRAGK